MDSAEQAFDNLDALKRTLYHFADSFDTCSVYDSNQTHTALEAGPFEMLVAVGLKKKYQGNTLDQIQAAYDSGHWCFLQLPYGDLNENLGPCNIFEPEMVFSIRKNEYSLKIHNNGIPKVRFQYLLRAFRGFEHEKAGRAPVNISFKSQTSRTEYTQKLEQIRKDIYNGKYYEMNFCIDFKAAVKASSWLPYYLILNKNTAAPFAAYVKNKDIVMLCSSPERFLLKQNHRLLSQPIKGTNKRLSEDENIAQLKKLHESEKERAENVMIVDLVRNDLAKVCKAGSIKVEELYKPYAYLSVNHLVSSVSGILNENVGIIELLQALYPMGSMTGAPKTEVMKHIALYETMKRGAYSGCLGYIRPNRDFDLNVLIRTLVYDKEASELTYKVGSAITFDSLADEEYEECMVKGSRMVSIFED